jgi:copper chaperone CopZ
MTTQTYKVTGMHCGGCKRNVERIANNYGKDSQVDVEK